MRKSEVNKVNALQRKPIHYAALEGHASIVEVLLDCGTKVRICSFFLKLFLLDPIHTPKKATIERLYKIQ